MSPTISKSTVLQNVWKNFYDTLKSNVTSVTLADSSTPTIQFYSSAFPDGDIDSSSDYPILIVNTAHANWTDHTFTKKWVNGTISIDVFTTKAESADIFCDKIIDTIETNRDDLRSLGLRVIQLDLTDKDEFFRGKLKIHVKTCTFSFKLIFTKTRSW